MSSEGVSFAIVDMNFSKIFDLFLSTYFPFSLGLRHVSSALSFAQDTSSNDRYMINTIISNLSCDFWSFFAKILVISVQILSTSRYWALMVLLVCNGVELILDLLKYEDVTDGHMAVGVPESVSNIRWIRFSVNNSENSDHFSLEMSGESSRCPSSYQTLFIVALTPF